MNATARQMNTELELKKAHINLMKHRETCMYAGVILMGESSVVYNDKECPTAYTDGLNKRYGDKFLRKLTRPQIGGLVLHENFHVLLKHIPRHRDLMKKNSRLANIAMDFVVNDMIHEIKDKTVAELPPGALYDPMFKGWSVRQVYDYIQEQMDKGGKSESDYGDPLDEHGDSLVDGMSEQEAKDLDEKIQEAIHQGNIIAGKFGSAVPLQIKDLMKPEVDWREVLRDYWTSMARGHDEYTWSRLNRRRMMDEVYLPTTYSERIGRIIFAIDTSGSISQHDLTMVASEIVKLCEIAPPDEVVVLWWDTEVRGKQEFPSSALDNIANLLQPKGGGGTRAGCVSKYLSKEDITADCMIMFTDGHVEDGIKWDVTIPTLWLISKQGNGNFVPPVGTQKVKINK